MSLGIFTNKTLREAVNVYEVLFRDGLTVDDLKERVSETRATTEAAIKEDNNQYPEPVPEEPEGRVEKPRESNRVSQPREKRNTPNFLKPGEVEVMEGVSCSECGEYVYIEGVCGGNEIVKEGYTRRGLCGGCGNEFLIR